MNQIDVMAKHFYGPGKRGGSRKARDHKFHRTFRGRHSHSNAVLSTRWWMNPSKDKWDLRVGLLTQNTGKHTTWQINSADYRQKEMQL